MAEITFDQLLDEQKKTTSSLNRLGTTLREQLLGDKSQEKDQRRVDAGNKAWQTRQTNIAEAGKKVGETTAVVDEKQTSFLERMLDKLNFLGKGTESAAQKKEGEKDTQSFLSKQYGKLGDIFKGGFKSMVGALKTFKTVAMGGLKALLLAAGLFLLIEFLQSPTWKKIREWIKDNPLKGVMIALVAVAAFFHPLKTLKVIRTLIGNVVLYVKNISKFFLWLGKILGKGILGSFKLMGKFVKVVAVSLEGYGKLFKKINAGFAKVGRGFTAVVKWVRGAGAWFANIGKTFKTWTTTGGKFAKTLGWIGEKIGKIFKWIKGIGSRFGKMLGGVSKFAGPLGLIISLGTAIFAAFTSFKERFAETGSIMESIETAVSTFLGTFIGVIPDLIKDGIAWVLRKIGEVLGIDAFTEGADALDSFSFSDLITEGIELFIDAVKALFKNVGYLARKAVALVFGEERTEKWFGKEEVEEKHPGEIRKEERAAKVAAHTEDLMEYGMSRKKAAARAEELVLESESRARKKRVAAAQAAEAERKATGKEPVPPVPSEPVPIDVVPTEPLPTESVPPKKVESEIRENIQKKAELEAAKAGGVGNITNIAQNNSSNVNQQRTTIQNKSMIDPETSQVVASGQT